MILVTGASGQLGRLTLERLLTRVPATQLVAGARSPAALASFAERGVAVRRLDYDDVDTLAPAFAGVRRVLLVSGNDFANRQLHHRRVIDAARAAGVLQLVYTSVLKAAPPAMRLAHDHAATEQYLAASGVPFTVLRNGWYNENWLGSLGPALAHGAMIGAAGAGVVSPAARADYADAAAAVLTSDGHLGRTYELAGDVGYTMADMAAILGDLGGKRVVYQDLGEAGYAQALIGFGLPEPVATILADADASIGRGALHHDGAELRRLIGRPTTPLAATFRAALG